MKHTNVPIERYRNIGIMAHIDAGKTTVSERILFYAGRIHIMGEVHHGDTIMDSDPEERARGITINSAATTVYWPPESKSTHRINLIDTPGHIDFTVEVERSLRVLDGAVCVLDGSQGVEPQTEQVWRQADRYGVARVVFVNKMDKAGANFAMSLYSLKEKLGIVAVPIQIPMGEEDKFEGIVDLIDMKCITFDDTSKGKKYSVVEIPEGYKGIATKARNEMIEALADVDDVILANFIEGRSSFITASMIRSALRKGTIERKIYPVLCGSALRNKGVQMLLDAVIDYLPSPLDLPPVHGVSVKDGSELIRKPNDKEPLSALVFKVVSDKNGNMTFIRIYSGTLNSGSYIYNSTRDDSERVARLVLVHADDKEPIESATAGTIVAAIGLKNSHTGDTLSSEKDPILLEKMEFPEPVVELLIEPKTKMDQDKMSIGLQKLLLEDPSLKVSSDEETMQTILKGMGELHLEIVVGKLRTNHGVDVNTGKPRVSYRETITANGSADYKHEHQTGGHGQYGHVVMNIFPAPRGSGLVFRSEIVGGAIPKEYIPAIEKGVKGAMDRGVIAGYPATDVEVVVVDGSFHAVDSSANSFEIAGSKAFQEAFKTAKPVILEPIMSLEVVTPEQYIGDVIGSIAARAGQVRDNTIRGNARVIDAAVPLRKLFGYTTELRGKTQGRAVPSVRFSHYDISVLKANELE